MTEEIKQPEKTFLNWNKKWWGVLVVLFIWPFLLTSWIWKKDWKIEARLGVIGLLWIFIWTVGGGVQNIWQVLILVVLLLSFYLTYYFGKQKISIFQKIGVIALVWFVYFLFVRNFKDNWIKPNENRVSNTISTVVLSPTPTVKTENSVEEVREIIAEKIEKVKEESRTVTSVPVPTKSSEEMLKKITNEQFKDSTGVETDYDEKKEFFSITYGGESTFFSETSIVEGIFASLVTVGKRVFQVEGVNSLKLIVENGLTDEYGKESVETIAFVRISKEEFQKYNWDNLRFQPIYYQMKKSCSELYIHPAILKKIDLGKIKLKY